MDTSLLVYLVMLRNLVEGQPEISVVQILLSFFCSSITRLTDQTHESSVAPYLHMMSYVQSDLELWVHTGAARSYKH